MSDHPYDGGMCSRDRSRRGVLVGVAAAVSFGAAAPVAKRLLEDTRPQLLAGLLYLGAFLVVAGASAARGRTKEAPLRRADVPRLAGVVVCGGILAPVLLLVGLERITGSAGSLLLNLEGPFTVVIGLAVFKEHLGRRALCGAAGPEARVMPSVPCASPRRACCGAWTTTSRNR